MKKISRKKNDSGKTDSGSPSSVNSGHSFYAQRDMEAPLDEYAVGYGQRGQRTSRHTPARRRENSNRASQSQLIILVLKIILIPVLLIAGYVALKLIVAHLEDPTEKDMERWEASAKVMEKGPVSSDALSNRRAGVVDFNDTSALKQQLDRLKQADRLLSSAEALERREMNEEAVVRLEEALRFAPENFAAQKLLLELNMKLKKYEDALPLCFRLLEQDPGDETVREYFLTALHGTDRTDASLLLAEQILETNPENLDVMEISAYDYAAKGEMDKALGLYNQVLQRDPNRLLALEGCGTIYDWKQEWVQALPYHMQLMKLDPQPRRYYVLAKNYARQNAAGKAVIFLGQAASLYGESEVIPWLSDPSFDPVRESVEFRSFADQVAGAKTREALEVLQRREVSTPEVLTPTGLELPDQKDLELLRPNRR